MNELEFICGADHEALEADVAVADPSVVKAADTREHLREKRTCSILAQSTSIRYDLEEVTAQKSLHEVSGIVSCKWRAGFLIKSFAQGPASIIGGEGVSKYPSPMHRLERTGVGFKAEKSRLSGAPAKKDLCGREVSLNAA